MLKTGAGAAERPLYFSTKNRRSGGLHFLGPWRGGAPGFPQPPGNVVGRRCDWLQAIQVPTRKEKNDKLGYWVA